MAIDTAAAKVATWSEQSFQDALQFIAEGLTELVGFGMTVISVRRGDELVVVATAGALRGLRADGGLDTPGDIVGSRWPIEKLQRLLDVADDWGRFKFVHHERAPSGAWVWVRQADGPVGDDVWHPNDGALAPIHDISGRLVGAISVDDPRTGRYPDAAQRRIMDKYAAEAAKVVLSALEREALEGRLKLAEGARQLVRTASRHLSLDRLLDETGPLFLEAFAATGLWLRIAGASDALITGSPHHLAGRLPTEELSSAVARAAEQLWAGRQAAIVYADGRVRNTMLEESHEDAIRELLTAGEFGSVLHAPIGAGEECLGSLVLARQAGRTDWSSAELDQAAEIGRDLGRIIRNGQTYARVQELVRELRALDAHKSHLIAMVSHELKNPLTVLLANRELLEAELAGDKSVLGRLADVDVNAQRMGGVVDNLLLLAKLADPETPHVEQPVGLRRLLHEVVSTLAPAAGRRRVSLLVRSPDEPLVVDGDPGELRTMLTNLLGNAIKFSSDGGSVEVSASGSSDEVEVAVADHGIGMSDEDRDQLFNDFFRSSDPAAAARPGSGLGLAIVDRILRRHGGRVDVTSALGRGSTFQVHLPRRPPVGPS
jgi:signal transduction histidine kinase